MDLYFDIGNTNIKLNYNFNNKEVYFFYKTKKKYSVDSFFYNLPKEVKTKKNHVIICSVVPAIEKIVIGVSYKYFDSKPLLIKWPIKTGVNVNVNDPKKVGSDLIALATYAASKGDNVIIVNLGTATTITYVKNNILEGIIIAPGLKTSFNSLIKRAYALKQTTLKGHNGLRVGKETCSAISIGVLRGHAHMIKGFINDIDKKAKVIISGGNYESIIFFVDATFVKEATIEGMKIIEGINKKVSTK